MTIYPTPSPEGIEKLKQLYEDEFHMEIPDETAFEILYGIMRFLYLTEINPPISEDTSN